MLGHAWDFPPFADRIPLRSASLKVEDLNVQGNRGGWGRAGWCMPFFSGGGGGRLTPMTRELSRVCWLRQIQHNGQHMQITRRREKLVKSRTRPWAPFAKGREKIDIQNPPPNAVYAPRPMPQCGFHGCTICSQALVGRRQREGGSKCRSRVIYDKRTIRSAYSLRSLHTSNANPTLFALRRTIAPPRPSPTPSAHRQCF